MVSVHLGSSACFPPGGLRDALSPSLSCLQVSGDTEEQTVDTCHEALDMAAALDHELGLVMEAGAALTEASGRN